MMTQTIEVTTEIDLDETQIAALFKDEYEGWCPVCKMERLAGGETICCSCFKKELEQHTDCCMYGWEVG